MSDRTHLRPLSPAKRIAQLEEQLDAARAAHANLGAVLNDLLLEKGLPYEMLQRFISGLTRPSSAAYDTSIENGFRPTTADVEDLPTIIEGRGSDLKIDTGRFRIWISRGPRLPKRMTLDLLDLGEWTTVETWSG